MLNVFPWWLFLGLSAIFMRDKFWIEPMHFVRKYYSI